MRVTMKYILAQCNEIFERVEIKYKAIDIHATRLLSRDYEGGAAFYIITIGNHDGTPSPHPVYVYVFYPISELQKMLNNGYVFSFELRERRYLSGAELGVRKK